MTFFTFKYKHILIHVRVVENGPWNNLSVLAIEGNICITGKPSFHQ